ncbi:MAG: hypothetical protein KGJ13_05840 [Patescibacteria group bacterium]|nr:hypothetical protein [Patescibacteria group bacterium]
MSNPFSEHAQNATDYQTMLKGDDNSGGATLTLFIPQGVPLTVDCRYERIIDNWELNSGQSPKLIVPGCKFMADPIPSVQRKYIRKGLNCSLKPNPDADDVLLRLDQGGLEQGGLSYEFVLVDRNYSA